MRATESRSARAVARSDGSSLLPALSQDGVAQRGVRGDIEAPIAVAGGLGLPSSRPLYTGTLRGVLGLCFRCGSSSSRSRPVVSSDMMAHAGTDLLRRDALSWQTGPGSGRRARAENEQQDGDLPSSGSAPRHEVATQLRCGANGLCVYLTVGRRRVL